MGMTVADVAGLVEELAPPAWAAEWDNVGLLLGSPEKPVQRVLVALEATDAVVAEAAAGGVDLLLLHHPIIFHPLKHLRLEGAANRRLHRLLTAGIAVYAAHTNFDTAPGGTNDVLAATLGLQEPRVLEPAGAERLCKLVTFVPPGHADAVRDAMAAAGAGVIGNYSHCSFQSPGTGTFRPEAGANPYLGRVGDLERAEELRLEVVVPQRLAAGAVAALQAAHPYEEVAYDLYPLANPGSVRGHGRAGRLATPGTLQELAGRVKTALGVPDVRIAGDPGRRIARAAVGAGAGGSLVAAAVAAGAEVLITGDIGHHTAQDALDAGLCLIDPGHWATEVIAMPGLARYLEQRLAALAGPVAVTVTVAAAQRPPLQSA